MSDFSDVSKFLAKFDGGARPNRYKVTLVGSPQAAGGKAPETFTFLCRAASIPASTVVPCVVAYMGRDVKVPGDRTFDDWTVSVYNTRQKGVASTRYYFEKWSDGILQNFHNITDGEEEGFWQSEAVVEQLDRGEQIINTYHI
jgi:hypothetical protein